MWNGASASSRSAICYSQPVSQLGSYANAPSCTRSNNMIYPPATGDLLFCSCSSYPAYLMLPVVHIPHRPQGQTDRQTERRSVCDVGSIFHFLDVHLYYLIKVRLDGGDEEYTRRAAAAAAPTYQPTNHCQQITDKSMNGINPP